MRVAVLCNYHDALAQTPNPQMLPPGRLEEIPVTPLPSDVLPKLPDKNQLLPSPKVPNQPIPGQDDPNARFGLIAFKSLVVQFSNQNSLPLSPLPLWDGN
ncbi:hypothetical protein [Nostoc sp.]